jgi:hypothetical protein
MNTHVAQDFEQKLPSSALIPAVISTLYILTVKHYALFDEVFWLLSKLLAQS